jgi:general secretion pathway protein B
VSYILDALRKSDLQRQHGAAPTLQSTHIAPRASGRSAYWVYGVLGTTLIGTGIAIGWLHPWQAGQPAPVAEPISPRISGSEPPQIATTPPLPTQSVLTPEPSVPAPVITPPSPAPSGAVAHAKAKAQTSNAQTADAAGPARSAPGTRVLHMSELPPAIQQEIPPMSISVHAYSAKPGERIVGINNRLLREGGTVPPGLTLDEITPDGMVFSYKGYRFRRGLGVVDSR